MQRYKNDRILIRLGIYRAHVIKDRAFIFLAARLSFFQDCLQGYTYRNVLLHDGAAQPPIPGMTEVLGKVLRMLTDGQLYSVATIGF